MIYFLNVNELYYKCGMCVWISHNVIINIRVRYSKHDMCCYKKTIYLSHVLKIRRVHKVLIKFFLLFDKDSCFQKYFPSSIGKITISQ